MSTKLSDVASAVWTQVQKLNAELRRIWDTQYPKDEIDAYNEYRAEKARAKDKDWKPIQHLAPVQYPDHVFPTIMEASSTDTNDRSLMRDRPDSELAKQANALLLFIGLNPSSPDTNILAKLHDYDTRNEKYDEIIQHEAAVWQNYTTYFGPIRDFRTPLFKYHVDLFAIRHTNAKVLEDFMCGRWQGNEYQRDKIRDFFRLQFNALHDFLQTVIPAQAIVINAMAGKIITGQSCLQHGQPYQEDPNVWTTNPARIAYPGWPTYMHSSGMMSSGNMDNGSKTRLEAVSYSVYRHGGMV